MNAMSLKGLQRDREGCVWGVGKCPKQVGLACLAEITKEMRYGHVSVVILVGLQNLLICLVWVFSKDEAASVG